VNSKKFDSYFSIYGDTLAFFCSNREGQLSDIYSAKVSVKNNLLASGEEYLSQDEWNKLIGKNVGQTLTFQNKSMILTKAQKEYLYFLANKVAPNDDLKFQIVVKQEEDPETSRSRLREIYGELRQAGIDSNRIREEHRSEHVDKGETGLIEVLVFKTTSN
jgi:type IV pilus biogenesis protein CpaD/CtpE